VSSCPLLRFNGLGDIHCRFVYRRVFVADGNFKADHVRQINPSKDVWLGEGAGMAPLRTEYMAFLETAKERRTVCPCPLPCPFPGPLPAAHRTHSFL